MTVTYVHDLAASKVTAISSKLLTDHEGDSHRARCEKRPSQCKCPDVHWIWASRPDKSEPVRSGKWMLFLSTMYVDSTWDQVKDLLSSGRLGSSAKVAPLSRTNNNSHLICIYTDDHQDVTDVFRVLVALRQNQIATSPIHYKTDEATHEGLHASSSAAAVAGFTVPAKKPKNYRVSKYSAPKINEAGTETDLLKSIKMYLNNIGPKLNQGIVAEFTVPSASQPSNQLKRKFDEMDGSKSGKGNGEYTPIELHLVATILDPPRLI